MGDQVLALKNINKALDIKPDYAKAYAKRGHVKIAVNDIEGAIDDFTRAIELEPTDFYSYGNRGSAKLILKDYPGAIKDLNKSIELNPLNAEGYKTRAAYYDEMGQPELAKKDLKRYEELKK